MKRNEFFLSQYGWKFGKKCYDFFFLNKRCNFLNNKQSPNEFSCGFKFYLVWLWRRVCRLEKFSSIDFLRNFDGKIEVFHVPLINFFFFERKIVSLSLKKIILFQVQRFFFLNIFRCKCDEKFWRKNTHSLFCNNFDFNKHFFSVFFRGTKYVFFIILSFWYV